MKLWDFSSKDIGIDLGTTNILMTLKGKGIVLREPAVVALDQGTKEIVATGKEAKEMLGRTPENIRAIMPMSEGVIADLTATSLMLKNMMRKICRKYNTGKPRVVVSVPFEISEVEERAVEETFLQSGAREVYLVDEPISAAIGAGLNVIEPEGKMVLDIGGGTSEAAIISYNGIVTSNSVKIAGNVIDNEIVEYLKNQLNIVIGLATAENLKIELGSAEPLVTEITKEVRGRDVEDGLPRNITISSKQVENAMKKPVAEIVETVITTLSQMPPELAGDIIKNGIYLTGGGALIKNLDNVIASKTGIKVYIADTPLDCVALGTGKILDNIDKYKEVLLNHKNK